MNEQTRKVLHSSDVMNWRTPPELFAALNDEFDFQLDAAASADNALCPFWYSEQQNALKRPWDGRVWCNPPYGRQIGHWTAHARGQVECGNAELVVMLIPSRTDTRWWHDDVMRAQTVRLIRGRLRFLTESGERLAPAPFPSALVIWERPRRYSTLPLFTGYSFEAAA
jgi:phage N-6-adenine-methyltransferase